MKNPKELIKDIYPIVEDCIAWTNISSAERTVGCNWCGGEWEPVPTTFPVGRIAHDKDCDVWNWMIEAKELLGKDD